MTNSLTTRIRSNANGMNKSGANALSLVFEAICEFDQSTNNDWTNLAWAVGAQKTKISRDRMAEIVKAATGGVIMVDKKQPSGYRLKKGTIVVAGSNSGEARSILADYVASGTSYLAEMDELLIKSAAKDYNLSTAVAACVRKANKESKTKAEFMKAAAEAWKAIEDADAEILKAA